MKPSARIIIFRRVGRATVGALWSLPLRFVTIPAIVAAMLLANGGALSTGDLFQWPVLASGIAVSVALRFLDNLMVEFALFPAVARVLHLENKLQ